MSGWIKLHRKINDNPILKKGKTYSNFEAFIWLLLRANYDNAKVIIGSEIYKLKQGQMITSKKKLMMIFNWGNSRLNTFLNLLEKDKMIDVKSNTKLTMITISNYLDYQDSKSETNIKQISNKYQPNTNKKNIKKNKRIYKEEDFIKQVKKISNKQYSNIMIDDFCNYWTEKNMTSGKMRFKLEKTFDISRRLARWKKNCKDDVVEVKEEIVEKRYQEQMQRMKEADNDACSDYERNEILKSFKRG